MVEFLTQKEAFLKCKRDGRFVPAEEVDREKIKSTVLIAEADMEATDTIRKTIPNKSALWNSVYKLYYDSLHELVEAFLRLDKVRIDNHQCLFAYLCEMHPELEFSWEFFEKIRTRRNGMIKSEGAPRTLVRGIESIGF